MKGKCAIIRTMRIGDFEVRRLGKGTCSVVQYKGEGAEIIIPPSFDKYTPVSIEATLVKKGARITKIAIPSTIDEIDEGLFPTLKNLEWFEAEKGPSYRSEDGVLYDGSFYSLIFYPPKRTEERFSPPRKLGRVASSAFSAGAHFRYFVYSSKLEEFSALPSQCPDLEAFLPAEDATDYDGVLIKNRKLLFYPPKLSGKSYTIPDGVEEIASVSVEPFFPGSVRTVFVPASLKRGLEHALLNAEKAEVDPSSVSYRSIDGVLYSWKRKLLSYPGRRKDEVYITPSGTDRIGEGAFRGSKLRTLVITPGVTAIEDSAFENSEITTIYIPQSVTDISLHALYGARNIKMIAVEKGSVAEMFLRGEGKSDILSVIPSLF